MVADCEEDGWTDWRPLHTVNELTIFWLESHDHFVALLDVIDSDLSIGRRSQEQLVVFLEGVRTDGCHRTVVILEGLTAVLPEWGKELNDWQLGVKDLLRVDLNLGLQSRFLPLGDEPVFSIIHVGVNLVL